MSEQRWTLLMTGEHSGLVGEAGNPWAGHPDHYDRIDVVRATPTTNAAPDLYEALESLIAAHGGEKKACGHDFTCVCAEDEARAALAKARGEAT